jgi:hypothetical protein
MVQAQKELNTEVAKCTADSEKSKVGGCEGVRGKFLNELEGLAASAKAEFWNAIFVMENWLHSAEEGR